MPKLTPVICGEYDKAQTVDSVIAAATANGRRRPMECLTADGQAVVCCRKTARKHGYTVTGKLYTQAKAPKAAPVEQVAVEPVAEQAAPAAPAPATKAKRSTKAK